MWTTVHLQSPAGCHSKQPACPRLWPQATCGDPHRCGNPQGCCSLAAGCNDSTYMRPYQECYRKFQLSLTTPNNYPVPSVYYTATDVLTKWPPGSLGGSWSAGSLVKHYRQPSQLSCTIPASDSALVMQQRGQGATVMHPDPSAAAHRLAEAHAARCPGHTCPFCHDEARWWVQACTYAAKPSPRSLQTHR